MCPPYFFTGLWVSFCYIILWYHRQSHTGLGRLFYPTWHFSRNTYSCRRCNPENTLSNSPRWIEFYDTHTRFALFTALFNLFCKLIPARVNSIHFNPIVFYCFVWYLSVYTHSQVPMWHRKPSRMPYVSSILSTFSRAPTKMSLWQSLGLVVDGLLLDFHLFFASKHVPTFSCVHDKIVLSSRFSEGSRSCSLLFHTPAPLYFLWMNELMNSIPQCVPDNDIYRAQGLLLVCHFFAFPGPIYDVSSLSTSPSVPFVGPSFVFFQVLLASSLRCSCQDVDLSLASPIVCLQVIDCMVVDSRLYCRPFSCGRLCSWLCASKISSGEQRVV